MEANILFIYKEHDPPMALRMESADESYGNGWILTEVQ